MTETVDTEIGEVDWQALIDRYYAGQPALRRRLMHHSADVASLALKLAACRQLPLPEEVIRAAAMLHDIGIIGTDAPGIDCHGTEPYIRHGIIGAAMLRAEGVPEAYARVAERHTGAGITGDDIATQNLPLPPGDYMPETTLEKLICFADKYFSKSGDGRRKTTEAVRASMLRHGPDTALRFDRLLSLFGDPDTLII